MIESDLFKYIVSPKKPSLQPRASEENNSIFEMFKI